MTAPSETEFRCIVRVALVPSQAWNRSGIFKSGWPVPWTKLFNAEGAREALKGVVNASWPTGLDPHEPSKVRVALNGVPLVRGVPTVIGGEPDPMN